MASASRLADFAGFEILDKPFAQDLESAICAGLTEGVVFPGGNDRAPLAIFREALAIAIRDIETHPRGELFQRFLTLGPYSDSGPIPTERQNKCLSDDDVASAIKFIYSWMVNAFQGQLAELLAIPACLGIINDLREGGHIPGPCRLYAGDTVTVLSGGHRGSLKGADLHVLVDPPGLPHRALMLAGVVEVKSYVCAPGRLRRQLARHVAAAGRGLLVDKIAYSSTAIGCGPGQPPIKIAVVPDRWTLPRTFRFVEADGRRLLRVDPGSPRRNTDQIDAIGPSEWRITLRWSKEALAAAAYEMTFWYMAKVGEVLYATTGVPAEWSPMTPGEAGQNAAKMMLYYAILRTRSRHEDQRAIALYNAYGFGYALGTSFKNSKGAREMLWPEDLEEILVQGVTERGCWLTS